MPDVLGRPLAIARRYDERGDAVSTTHLDHHVLVQDRSLRRGRRWRGVRALPEELAGGRRHADEIFLRERHHLARARQVEEQGRSVGGTIAVPAPAHVARGDVERGQRAVVMTANVHDDVVAVHERRHRRVVKRFNWRRRLLPELFPCCRVERGNLAAHAECEDAVIGERRSRFGARSVRRGRRVHLERRRIAGAPDRFAGARIECGHDFVFVLTREDVDSLADHQWHRIAGADFNLPAFHEGFRPRRWLAEQRNGAVAGRTAPLRPILRRYRGRHRRYDHRRPPRSFHRKRTPTGPERAKRVEGSISHGHRSYSGPSRCIRWPWHSIHNAKAFSNCWQQPAARGLTNFRSTRHERCPIR